MRLTTKGRYAVTAMLDLALHADQTPICLADISRRQEISLSYLEQLFAKLRRAKLVKSVRGPGGGYLLAVSPAAVSVARVETKSRFGGPISQSCATLSPLVPYGSAPEHFDDPGR